MFNVASLRLIYDRGIINSGKNNYPDTEVWTLRKGLPSEPIPVWALLGKGTYPPRRNH